MPRKAAGADIRAYLLHLDALLNEPVELVQRLWGDEVADQVEAQIQEMA